MRYYYSGMPRSNELYHHGILGQKWGVRRYQNSDGSLTPLGRVHYGVKTTSEKIASGARSAGRAVGSAAKATGKKVASGVSKVSSAAVKAYKRRHPSLMSDEELAIYTQRLANEKRYVDILKGVKGSNGSNARKFIGDIFAKGSQTLADAAFRKLAEQMTKSRDQRLSEALSREASVYDAQVRADAARREAQLNRAYEALLNPGKLNSTQRVWANNILDRYQKADSTFTTYDVDIPGKKKK